MTLLENYVEILFQIILGRDQENKADVDYKSFAIYALSWLLSHYFHFQKLHFEISVMKIQYSCVIKWGQTQSEWPIVTSNV